MLWVAWLGREGRGEVDRDVAVRAAGRRAAARAPGDPDAAAGRAARPQHRHRRTPLAARLHGERLTRPGPPAPPCVFPPGERLGAMTQRTLAGLLAVPLLVALWFQVAARAASLRDLRARADRRRARHDDGDGEEIIEVSGARGLPGRRPAPVHHGAGHPAGDRRQPLPAARRVDRRRRRGLPLRRGLRPRGHRRVGGRGGRLPDGDLPGQRDRGRADRAGVRREPGAAGGRGSSRARRPTASSRSATTCSPSTASR